MSDFNTQDKILYNDFSKGLWKDALPSLQPKGSWRDAWGIVKETDEESFYGVSNEGSTEIFVKLPGQVRSLLYIEERKYFVAFILGEGVSEIGLIYKNTQTYRKLTDFTLDNCEFNDITYKITGECNELSIYFSAGNTYYTLNIDDPCCEYVVEPLLDCSSGSLIDADVVDGGSLPNGSYKFTYQLVDDDGNDTNFFTINNPVYVAEDDKVPGERTNKAINLSFNVFSDKYSVARIAVIKNIGVKGYEIIGTTGISKGKNSFFYSGSEDTDGLTLEEIRNRKDYYIRGKNLVQYQNRLILYNILPKYNLNWQREANKLRIKYVNYVVPLEFAELFKGLMPNEKYWFGIRFNYCDNTTSAVFTIPGLEASGGTSEGCDDCDLPSWKTSDTSLREQLYLTDVSDTSGIFYSSSVSKQSTSVESSKDCEIIPKSITSDEEGNTTVQTRGSGNAGDNELGEISVGIDGDLIMDCGLAGCSGETASDCPDCLDSQKLADNQEDIVTQIEELDQTFGTELDKYKYLTTAYDCKQEGAKYENGDICYECIQGKWCYVNNSYYYNNEYVVTTDRGSTSGFDPSEYAPEIIYGEDGCTIDEIVPKRYSKGSFGVYETTEKYPTTLDDDCELLWGDLAGKNVRLHVAPSRANEPNSISFTTGVKHKEDTSNEENANGFVFMLGVELENLVLPTDTPKPLDEDNPYTIMMVERTPGNTSVIGSAILSSTFLGSINGEVHAFPKHGMNSFEFFDANINPSGANSFRGGYTNNLSSAYTAHSPDFNLYRPGLNADFCIFEQELYDKGYRHGWAAEGEKPDQITLSQENNFGTRQSLALKHSIPFSNAQYECVKAMSYAPEDKIISKGTDFTLSLCNLERESSVYVELDRDGFVPFTKDPSKYGGGNGSQGVGVTRDGASDTSFTGDIMDPACPIHNVRAHDVTFVKDIPDQYGSPLGQVFIPMLHGKTSGLVGDSFINSYNIRRTGFVSDKTPKDLSVVDFSVGEQVLDLLDKLDIKFEIPSRKIVLVQDNWFTGEIAIQFPGFELRPFKNIILMMKFVLRPILRLFFNSIGYDKCGDVPKAGNKCDQRNYGGGLRGNPEAYPSNPLDIVCMSSSYDGYCESTEGNIPSPANRGNSDFPDDTYLPHVLKSTIYHVQNSNINHHHRQTGEVLLGDDGVAEVFNFRLKNLKLDTSFYEGMDWRKSYLERFYVLRKSPPRLKVIGKALTNFFFTYGIGFGLIIKAIITFFQALSSLFIAAGAVFATNFFGLLVAGLVATGFVALGLGWIYLWASIDLDNRFFDRIFGLDSCRPDKKFPDGSYGIKRGRVKQFEDNYHRYSLIYNEATNEERSYAPGIVYNTQKCENPINKFVYSEPQIPSSTIDSWRNFKVNNYQELRTDYGSIQKIFEIKNSLYVHTSDMIMDLLSGRRTIDLNRDTITGTTRGSRASLAGDTLLLGQGNLFSGAVPLFGGVPEGYAGLTDPNAMVMSRYGAIWADREAKKLFLFDGSNLKPISDIGMRGYFQENFDLKLLKYYPNYKYVDTKGINSVGYSLGVDNEHNRLLFTKIDYEPVDVRKLKCVDGKLYKEDGSDVSLCDTNYFIDKSFTLSFDFEEQVWISNHWYLPRLYTWDRFNMYSFNKEGMWLHNSNKGNFNNFYGIDYPTSIDLIINDLETRKAFELQSMLLDTEAYKYKGDAYLQSPKETFDQLILSNSHQSTPQLLIKDKDSLDTVEKLIEGSSYIKSQFNFDGWSLSEFPDKLVSENEFIFNKVPTIGPDELNLNNISSELKNSTFTDNYLQLRLIFSIFADRNNTKLFLKNLSTNVEIYHNQ